MRMMLEKSTSSMTESAAASGQLSVTVASLNTSVPRTNTRPPPISRGVTKDEIQAVLMQALVYCGAPAALAAFRTASAAIADWDREHASGR